MVLSVDSFPVVFKHCGEHKAKPSSGPWWRCVFNCTEIAFCPFSVERLERKQTNKGKEKTKRKTLCMRECRHEKGETLLIRQ